MSQTRKPLEYYTDSDRPQHEVSLQILYGQLKGRTYKDRISGTDLAEMVPVSRSTCYDLVQELRADWGLAVYSRGGYFEVQDEQRLDDIIKQINDQISTMEQTKQDLARNFNQGKYE